MVKGVSEPSRPLSVLDEKLFIQGDVTAKGPVQIDGYIEGTVSAPYVAIRGRLIGCIQADAVRLQPDCHVEGDIFYRTLTIEHGAHFDGRSRSLAKPETG